MSIWAERVTRVWLGLVLLTVVTTWGLSKDLLGPAAAVVGTFLIAGVKVGYVMADFMELRSAPTRVRLLFQGWIIAVIAIILASWFRTP